MESATRTTAIVFAHTIVDAPKNGAISRAAAISAPSVEVPTTKTSSSRGGSRRACAAPVPASGSVLVEAEIGLAGPADRAVPVGGNLLERRPRRDAPVGITFSRVVDEPAGLADPLLGCARRSHRLIVGSPVHGGRQTGSWRSAQYRGRDDPPRGRHGDRAARRRRRARGAARQAQSGPALHGWSMGVPRRCRRLRRGPPRGRRARGRRGGVGRAARRRGARRVLALDHAGGSEDPLRYALLPGGGARGRLAGARRRRDRRPRLVLARRGAGGLRA